MDRHMKIIYMTPCILFLIVMVVFPLLYTFRLSFFDWGMSTVTEPEFIGLKNYSELLHDQYFISSIWITLKYSLISVILEVLIGIILALMLNRRKLFMRNVFKTVMLIPMSMTPVAVGMILFGRFCSDRSYRRPPGQRPITESKYVFIGNLLPSWIACLL